MRKWLLPLLLVSLAFTALAVACGDDDDDKDKGNDEGAKATATAAKASDQKSGGGKIADLKSFEYEMSIAGLGNLIGAPGGAGPGGVAGEFSVKGAYKAPDRASSTIKIAGQELSNIVIGKEQWLKVGGSWIGPTPADDTAKDNVLAIAFWDEGFQSDGGNISCPDAKTEKLNGVEVRHCTLDAKDIAKLAAATGETADFGDLNNIKIDAWLAKDGDYPVKFEFTGTDKTTKKPVGVKFELKNINGDVKIDPPK